MSTNSNWNRDPFVASPELQPVLRAKHYQSRVSNLPKPKQAEHATGHDKPLRMLAIPSDRARAQLRTAAEDVLRNGAALGGDPAADGERWLQEYLDAHHELQADFLCEVYDAAIRAVIAGLLSSPRVEARHAAR